MNADPIVYLRMGTKMWNLWRKTLNDNSEEPLYKEFDSTLNKIFLPHIRLRGAELAGANLRGTTFHESSLRRTDFEGADFRGSDLSVVNFHGSNLKGANFQAANLWDTNFSDTDLTGANFTNAILGLTKFGDNDLSAVIGLESIRHSLPSTIGIDTLYRSQGNIPEVFLRGCGVPEDIITYMHSFVTDPIQYHSCFISYSHKDEEFVKRLYWRMRSSGLRVWYAAEDMAGGEKIHEQIERAIQLHDRLLIVLSEHSLKSEWVVTEIRKARKQELKRGTRKLFPISLVDFNTIKEWECFDSDNGKDLAVEIREYFIPDFANWKNHDSFETAFERLYRDLKMNKSKNGGI